MTTQYRGRTFKRPPVKNTVLGEISGGYRGHSFRQGKPKVKVEGTSYHGQYRGRKF